MRTDHLHSNDRLVGAMARALCKRGKDQVPRVARTHDRDVVGDQRWLVVGYREEQAVGVILGGAASPEEARELRDRLASQLEDYERVSVERCREPKWKE